MMDTMTLTEFLLARIAEDEAAANHEARGWETGSRFAGQPPAWTQHVERWPVARVLAECEAKRRIVAWHHQPVDAVEVENLKRGPTWGCVCYDGWPCPTLRALALPHADHPDYQPEWHAP